MKHVTRIWILAGSCVPHVPNTLNQEELMSITKEKEKKIEIKVKNHINKSAQEY